MSAAATIRASLRDPDGLLSQATDVALGLLCAAFGLQALIDPAIGAGARPAARLALAAFFLLFALATSTGAAMHVAIARRRRAPRWMWAAVIAGGNLALGALSTGLVLLFSPWPERAVPGIVAAVDLALPCVLNAALFVRERRAGRPLPPDRLVWRQTLLHGGAVCVFALALVARGVAAGGGRLAWLTLAALAFGLASVAVQAGLRRRPGLIPIDHNSAFHILLGGALALFYVGLLGG